MYSEWEQLKWAGWDKVLWIYRGWCPQHGKSPSIRCPVCNGIKEKREIEEIEDD